MHPFSIWRGVITFWLILISLSWMNGYRYKHVSTNYVNPGQITTIQILREMITITLKVRFKSIITHFPTSDWWNDVSKVLSVHLVSMPPGPALPHPNLRTNCCLYALHRLRILITINTMLKYTIKIYIYNAWKRISTILILNVPSNVPACNVRGKPNHLLLSSVASLLRTYPPTSHCSLL